MFNPDGMIADARKRREPSYVAGTGPLWTGVLPPTPEGQAGIAWTGQYGYYALSREEWAPLLRQNLLRFYTPVVRMAEYIGSDPT